MFESGVGGMDLTESDARGTRSAQFSSDPTHPSISASPADFSFIQACAYYMSRLGRSECAVERRKVGGLQRESGMDPEGGRTRTTGNARAKVSSRSSSLPCPPSVLSTQQDECAPVSQGEEEG